MSCLRSGVLVLLLFVLCEARLPELKVSKIILTDVPSFGLLTIPPYVNGERWPRQVNYSIQVGDNGTIVSGYINTTDSYRDAVLLHTLLLPKITEAGHVKFKLRLDPFRKNSTTTSLVLPAVLSILPVFLTPIFCLISRHVVIGLLLSLWVAASMVYGDPATGFIRMCDTYLVSSMNSDIHSRIIIFLVLLSGVIAMVQKSGGTMAISLFLRKKATTSKRGQFVALCFTSLLSIDDRASIMIVGQSLGPLLASVGVTSERVACIIHTISVCLASILPVSTWTAIQVGFVTTQYQTLDITTNPWIACMKTLPYRIFPILAIYSIVLMLFTGREMSKTDPKRERTMGGGTVGMSIVDDESVMSDLHVNYYAVVSYDSNCLEPKSGVVPRIVNALVPVMILVLGTPLGMWLDGLKTLESYNQEIPSIYIPQVFSESTSVNALIWSTMAALGVSLISNLTQKILSIEESVSAWVKGLQNSVQPLLIILSVWALELAISELHTADYLSHALDSLAKEWLPVITFVVTCFISYVCGSSFASMGILFPVVVPFAAHLGRDIVLTSHLSPDEDLIVKCMGAILGGSILGDLSSPLSETTLLTSLSTGCSLSTHTSSQVQFMVSLCLVSLLACVVPVSFNWMNIWEALSLAIALIAVVVYVAGASSDGEGYLIGLFRKHRIKAPLLSRWRAVNQHDYASSAEGYESNDEILSN